MNADFLQFYTATPKFTHAPGLAVMGELCARLGDPQAGLRCIHIAGTNGKGSCAAMAAAVLQAAGYRTGLYTSPDLTGPWERIKIDGVDINLSDFAAVTARVRAACAGLDEPSYFEKMTAAAFLYFAEKRCDYVVLETGLGGRLDATNVIKKPAVSIIMPIGLDHTNLLGDTLSAIAGEKAGIIKPGCPVVCAPQREEALAVIRARCASVGASLHEVDINKLSPGPHSLAGQRFSYGDLTDIDLALLGRHQAENACAVLETAQLLDLSEQHIRTGLAAAQWPCRFEYIPVAPPFLLDGAHNPHGATALAAGLGAYLPGQKCAMLMGAMADKDWRVVLKIMEPLAARFICITPDDSPRSLPASELAAAVRTVPAQTADSLPEALALCREHEEPVCAFGSLYYIGHLRKLLLEGKPWN